MNGVLFSIGLLLLGLVALDILVTTISMLGQGPISRILARSMWQTALSLNRRTGSDRLLIVMGPLILMVIVLLWILMLWSAYFLMFFAGSESVLVGKTGAPADGWGVLYFSGFTLFTLGVGDLVPNGSGWQFLTAVGSLNGLFLITLTITYIVPLLSAVAQKEQLAGAIDNLGSTPHQILLNAWNGKDFEGLGPSLVQLSSQVELHALRHLAYPILHYFHGTSPHSHLPTRLAALHDALLLLKFGLVPRQRPAPAWLDSLLQSIHCYLELMAGKFIPQQDQTPDPPTLDPLHSAGMQTVPPQEFAEAVAQFAQERRNLLSLICDFGNDWEDVVAPQEK